VLKTVILGIKKRYKSILQTESSQNAFSPCFPYRQVFSPDIPIVRKPNEELLFLFRAVCAIFDALADKSNAGNSIRQMLSLLPDKVWTVLMQAFCLGYFLCHRTLHHLKIHHLFSLFLPLSLSHSVSLTLSLSLTPSLSLSDSLSLTLSLSVSPSIQTLSKSRENSHSLKSKNISER
jgi:hypothetical protein